MKSQEKKCNICGEQITDSHECQQLLPPDDHENGDKEPNIPQEALKSSATIAALTNRDSNERFVLTQSVSKIGRDKSNTISLHTDSYVSRHHAWVLCIKGDFYVEDLGSTNGTLLNGEILSERKQIQPGDCIKLGRTELVFELN